MAKPSASALKPQVASTRPAISQNVVIKLALTMISLLALPLATYFVTLERVFNGNTTYAAGTAAAVANFVMIGYIIIAYYEDDVDKNKQE